jgi:hypothetical protein
MLTINWDQEITQDKLNEVSAFKKSLGHDARVLFNRSGNEVTFTEHRESLREKFFRKLDKFEKNVQAAWSRVNNRLTDTNQGNSLEGTKNIKGTPIHKSSPPDSSSMSVKKFNLEIASLSNTCIIPVLDDLAHQRDNLNNLARMIREMNLNYALDFFSTGSQSLDKVYEEFSAFAQFAQAQGRGESVTHQNRDAINFANRWVAIPLSEHEELRVRFGESYHTISSAALELAAFAVTSPFDKP